MNCARCGADLEKGARFCGRCGLEQPRHCAGCGAEAGVGDRFCGVCGAPLAQAADATAAAEAGPARRRRPVIWAAAILAPALLAIGGGVAAWALLDRGDKQAAETPARTIAPTAPLKTPPETTSAETEVPATTASAARESWTMFRHDAQHTGRSTVAAAQSGREKSGWPVQLGAVATSSPPAVGADGTVYVVTDDAVYALAPTGKVRWRRAIGNPALANDKLWGSPALSRSGTVYVLGLGVREDTWLYALASNGGIKWRLPTGRGGGEHVTWPSPTVGPDGTVYVINGSDNLYAVAPTGEVRWRFRAEEFDAVYAVPTLARDGTIYVASRIQERLYALSSNGAAKWFVSVPGGFESSPAVGSDGTVYFGSYAGHVYAVSPAGKVRWRFKSASKRITSSPALSRDGTIVVVGQEGGRVYALRPDGRVRWRFTARPCPGSIVVYTDASPTIGGDGTVYMTVEDCGQRGGTLYALRPNGSLKFRLHVEEASSPVIGPDGSVYLTETVSVVHALARS